MAPIRRYLRISPYSVLEVRIYLDNPSDAQRWLLRSRDPVLPRVVEAVRPYVLPKLREENERAKKGGKRKGFKDVVHTDEFEASIFLTELSSPHSILTRHKHFAPKESKALGTQQAPMEIDDEDVIPNLRQESDDEDSKIEPTPSTADPRANRLNAAGNPFAVDDEDDDDDEHATGEQSSEAERDTQDEKKKLGLTTMYDGFRIYGRILCLVVKRKGKSSAGRNGQAMVEEWISSTQAKEDGGSV